MSYHVTRQHRLLHDSHHHPVAIKVCPHHQSTGMPFVDPFLISAGEQLNYNTKLKCHTFGIGHLFVFGVSMTNLSLSTYSAIPGIDYDRQAGNTDWWLI